MKKGKCPDDRKGSSPYSRKKAPLGGLPKRPQMSEGGQ